MKPSHQRGNPKPALSEGWTPVRMVADSPWRGRGFSVVLGVTGSLLLHAAVLVFVPDELPKVAQASEVRPEDRIELYLDMPREEAPEEFVVTNPDVPANPPDETDFFSDRDQQAAQEEESDEGDPSLPDVEGEEPEPTQNIVPSEDRLAFPVEEVLDGFLGEDGADGEPVAWEPLPERLIPGFEPVEGGEGLDVPVTPEEDELLEEEPVFGVDLGEGEVDEDFREPVEEPEDVEEPEEVGEMAEATPEERQMPRPRPRLSQHSTGPTGIRQGAAPRVGDVAVDANFSEYGDYLKRMLDVIVRQWHMLAWDSLPSGEVGTLVSLSFRVDSAGEVHGVEVLGSTAGLTATLICKDAVSARQPYGEWTPDMREVLGDEQTIRIRFHYR